MLERHLEGPLRAALADTPAVVLVGARQCGKSTLCQALTGSRFRAQSLTFDDAAVLAAAKADPAGFIAALDGPVVLDEIQQAPELLPAVKLAIDRHRQPGRFLLTGSANVLALPQVAESLVGRAEVLTLWPFSQGELDGHRERFVEALFSERPPVYPGKGESRAALVRRVLRGGYPEVVARRDEDRRRSWFGAYVTTILQRDVRDLASIESLPALPRLLSLVAARSASLLNFAELSRASGLPQTTLKRYMALLEHTFLVRTVPAWSANLSKRFVKTPRVMLTDTGLLAYLRGTSEPGLRANPVDLGPLFESFVAMEIVKLLSWSRVHATLFHYRTHGGEEVDFVLEADAGRLAGIEVKAAATVTAADFKGLKALQAALGPRFVRGVVLYTGAEAVPFGPRLWAVPLDALWKL